MIGDPVVTALGVQGRQVVSYHLERRPNVVRRRLAIGQVDKRGRPWHDCVTSADQRDLMERYLLTVERSFHGIAGGSDHGAKRLQQGVLEVRIQRPEMTQSTIEPQQ